MMGHRWLATAIVALSAIACSDDAETTSTTTGTTTSSAGGGGAGGASTSSTTGGGGAGGAPTEMRVFLTSAVHDGDLGGIPGADTVCQDAAAGLGGTWLPWLSAVDVSPATRFTRATVPYVLLDGTEIAASFDDLVDGTLAAPIDVDEAGNTLPAADMAMVWTGTGADGAAFGGNCSDWMDDMSGGVFGSPTATDATWSFLSGGVCTDQSRHLYCFEQ
jgi:hypothetical protein